MGGIVSIPAILATVGTAVGASAATATIVGASVIAGVVGTTLSVVGTITKNKTLSMIGLGLGVAGALTGLAASAGLFSGVTEATTALQGGVGAAAETTAQAGTIAGQAGTVGIQTGAAPGATAALESIPAAAAPPGGFADLAALGAQGPVTSTATGVAPAVQAAGAVQNIGVAAPAPAAPLGGAMNPVAPPVPLAPAVSAAATTAPAASDFMKVSAIMAASQMGAGALGGIFQGMSADKQMELQELINRENRAQFSQQFERATSSPGLIQFGGQKGPGPGSGASDAMSQDLATAQKAIQSAPALDANWWAGLDPATKASIMKVSGGKA